MHDVLISQFEQLGVAVKIVTDGAEAVVALQHGDFAMVFMDCQMPTVDGFEATKLIREDEHSTGMHVPIIAMTANAFKEDRDACIAAGMDDYLAKPVRLKNLKDISANGNSPSRERVEKDVTIAWLAVCVLGAALSIKSIVVLDARSRWTAAGWWFTLLYFVIAGYSAAPHATAAAPGVLGDRRQIPDRIRPRRSEGRAAVRAVVVAGAGGRHARGAARFVARARRNQERVGFEPTGR